MLTPPADRKSGTIPSPFPGTTPKAMAFDLKPFLALANLKTQIVRFKRNAIVFAQGTPAKSVVYIQEGGVRLKVVNAVGKEAVVAILGPGDFVGEGCLAGQRARIATATAIGVTTVLTIQKDAMILVMHTEPKFANRFMSYMLARNIRIEEDLIDQLFNSSEKRLARTLLLLAHYGKNNAEPEKVITKISQQTLAEMIGTTRSRVNFFMNRFRKLGFIQYNGEIRVNSSLLTVLLRD
jgi:CRP/FNR family cyclic AMP-dependent transcriptional regulator